MDAAISKKKALERIFVYQAVELGYLTQDHLISCIDELENQEIPIPLLTICKQKGYLKPSQVNHLMSKRMDKSIAKAFGEGLAAKRATLQPQENAPQRTSVQPPPVLITTSEKEEYERLIAAKDRLLERLQQKLNERNQLLTNFEQKKKQTIQEVLGRKQSQIESLESELACYRGLYEKSKGYEDKLKDYAENLRKEKESKGGLKKLMAKLQEDLQLTEEKFLALESELEKYRNSADFIKNKAEKEVEERKKLKEKYQNAEDMYIKLQNRLAQTQNELDVLKKYYEESQKTCLDMEAEIKNLKGEKQDLSNKAVKLEEEIQKSSKNKEEYQEFFGVADELKQEHEEENAKLKEELERKQRLEEEHEELQKKYNEEVNRFKAQLETEQNAKQEHLKNSEDLRKQMRSLEDKFEAEKTQVEESIYQQKSTYESEISQYKQKNENLQVKLDQYQQSLADWDDKDKEIDQIKQRLEIAQENAKKVEASKLALQEELDQLQKQMQRVQQLYIDGELETGAVLPGSNGMTYEVQKLLGAGGMGMVYSATRSTDQEIVVIKTLLPEAMSDLKVLMRFVQEARTIISFDHENLITGNDLQQSKDLSFFVMEYLDGESLEEMLDDLGILDVIEATEIIWGIAKALQYLEENCLVHRDVKPANIIITTDSVPKLVDFGIVKMTDRTCSLTTEGIILGTPYYLSPEQTYQTNVDIRSDIYSLGATYYHMVVGEVPFPGDNPIDVIQKRLERSPRPGKVKPDLPKPVCSVIEKMMNKNVKKRHSSASELVSDLQNVLKKIRR
ncbi:protein kinase [Candidatus Uabimicrobium sp. HlEnr_7]|uniref:protein kinase domain-containing protein n=1 Tax=Candidatus Uabimicrobium helgolandensis TaxID=3095367 RepID=UPI00355620B0